MVMRAMEAADQLSAEGIHVEIIDPRTIHPLDMEPIVASIIKTGKVLITHEAVKTVVSVLNWQPALLRAKHLATWMLRCAGWQGLTCPSLTTAIWNTMQCHRLKILWKKREKSYRASTRR
jgi:pyruvate/2-oxoglutarate/acetoin dehydrogenase E1 component